MIGVAIISITLVPALIPTFIRGRLRREEENWLVRTLIDIYKPVLTWAMPHRNVVLWLFAVLLILGAGLFPLNACLRHPLENRVPDRVRPVTVLTVAFMDGGAMADRRVRQPGDLGPGRFRLSPDSAKNTCRRWTKAASSTCRSACRGHR